MQPAAIARRPAMMGQPGAGAGGAISDLWGMQADFHVQRAGAPDKEHACPLLARQGDP
jgi:hypothetical protein